jgi:thioredoxin-related protein
MKAELGNKLAAKENQFDWYSYNDALEVGRKDNKYVMVVFYTDWCKWCKKMKDETMADPAVSAYLKNNFAVTRVNAESSSTVIHEMRKVSMIELAEAYGVTQFPTVWFLEPGGQKAKPLNGYLPPEDFLVYLKYINTGSYRVSE